MNAFAIVQAMVIALVVATSAWVTFSKLAPGARRNLLSRLSAMLDKPGRPRLLRFLGRRMQPADGSGNCNDGCAACGACYTPEHQKTKVDLTLSATKAQPIPLEFRSPR